MSIDTPNRDRNARSTLRILLPALAVMALSGCAAVINPSMIASAVVDGISYMATGKGPADHLISGLTDQDCAMHRGFTDKPVCTPARDEVIVTGAEVNANAGQAVANPTAGQPVEEAERLGGRQLY